MMLGLVRDVVASAVHICRVHRENGVTALPGELGALGFEKDAGCAFQFLDQIRLAGRSAKVEEQVNVVRPTADDDRRAVEPLGDSAQIGVSFCANLLIFQVRNAVFS